MKYYRIKKVTYTDGHFDTELEAVNWIQQQKLTINDDFAYEISEETHHEYP